MKPRVLITGAGGQDGRLLSHLLVGRGHDVVGLVRRADAVLEPGVARLVADVGDRAALAAALDAVRPARIFHLAAAHHSSAGAPDGVERNMVKVNFEAAATLLDWMARTAPAARLVLAGSSQMYTAPAAGELAVDETTPEAPATFYGRTKADARAAAAAARAAGLHAGTAILFNHESELRGPGFVTRRLVDAAATRTRVEVMNAAARVDWSAARDVVDGLARMAEAAAPGDYVFGSGTLRSVRDWARVACARARVDPAAILAAASDRPTGALVANPARAARELGWQPRIGFAELVDAMVDDALRGSRSPGTAR
jgi:GDPmannose 4,6-dehydratase